METIVVYHNDVHGKTCVKYLQYVLTNNVKLIPSTFDKAPLHVFKDTCNANKNNVLYIIGLYYKPEDIHELCKRYKEVRVFVNSKLLCDELIVLKKYKKVNNLTGVWSDKFAPIYGLFKFHNPEDTDVPKIILYLNDYHQWQFKYKYTKYFMISFSYYILNHEKDIEWNILFDNHNIADDANVYINRFIQEGMLINKAENIFNNWLLDNHAFITNFHNLTIMALNYKTSSDIFNDIKDKDFIDAFVTYQKNYNNDKKPMYMFSITTSKQDIDVSEIAKVFNGNGKREVAGFITDTLPFKQTSKKHREDIESLPYSFPNEFINLCNKFTIIQSYFKDKIRNYSFGKSKIVTWNNMEISVVNSPFMPDMFYSENYFEVDLLCTYIWTNWNNKYRLLFKTVRDAKYLKEVLELTKGKLMNNVVWSYMSMLPFSD